MANQNGETSLSVLTAGWIKQNPTFVQVLGMCPVLAVSTSADNALGMGLATLGVLTLSNLFISFVRNIIPNEIRIPVYISIIAAFVTVVNLLMHGYTYSLWVSLGIYIPLIVVNCVPLGRAEVFASKHGPWKSFLDGVGMGMFSNARLQLFTFKISWYVFFLWRFSKDRHGSWNVDSRYIRYGRCRHIRMGT